MSSTKTKKQTPASKGNKQASVVKEKQQSSVSGEIKLLVAIGVFLLLFLGNFGWAGSGDTGINWISNRLKGVFGVVEYILPVYLLLSALYCYFNKNNRRLRLQITMAGMLGICLCIFFSLIHGSSHMELKISEYYADGMETLFSGGLVGGVLATLLYRVFGMIGAFVLLLILVIIFVVLMTEKSFVAQVQKAQQKGSDAYQQSKAHRVEQREVRRQQQEYQQQQPQRRKQQPQERKSANGMSVITLQKEKKRPKKNVKLEEEMHEVFAQPADESFGGNMLYDEKYAAASNTFTIERNGKVKEFSYEQEAMAFEEGKVMPVEPEAAEPVMHTEEKPQTRKRRSSQKAEPEEPVWTPELEMHKESDDTVYQKPGLELLQKGKGSTQASDSDLAKTGMKLQQTLQSFGVNVSVTNVSCGPSVTRYELQPEQGVKVSRIVNLADDIKLNLAVSDIRIEAPIPGKAAVGIEVPNAETSAVLLRDLIETKQFADFSSPLTFAVGKDISGQVIVADIAKMPHLLIAGATGSGKSVCINTLIMSLLYKADPKDVKLIMIDPKVVELSVYNGIPHMMIPVVTDPKKAAGALNWAVVEMTERYKKFADFNVRDLKGYNAKVDAIPDTEDEKPERLPQIVIIVDELADLMMVSKNEVEDAICRLAQLARAAGIHLIIATQRPSVDVITGLIKANMPSRIAFAVSSGVDSRTIIDINGAEKLLGKGDMLFYPSGYPKPVRVQGAFVSDKEVSDVVKFLSEQNKEVVYNKDIEEKMRNAMTATVDSGSSGGSEYDDYFVQAGKFVIDKGKASTSMIQRVFKVGFNRAARIMDQLEEAGVVSAEDGTKPRHILMSENEFEQFVEESV